MFRSHGCRTHNKKRAKTIGRGVGAAGQKRVCRANGGRENGEGQSGNGEDCGKGKTGGGNVQRDSLFYRSGLGCDTNGDADVFDEAVFLSCLFRARVDLFMGDDEQRVAVSASDADGDTNHATGLFALAGGDGSEP